MNKHVPGIDAWRTVVMVQTIALTVHAAPPAGYGGRIVALAGLALVALMTVAMAASRPALPRWLRGWALLAAGFSAFAAASAAWSLAPRVSLEDAITTTVMLAFVFLSAATRWQDRMTLQRDLAFLFGLVVVLQATAMLAGAVGVDTVYDPDYGRYRGWFSNANYAGIMSAVGLSIGLGNLLAGSREVDRTEEASAGTAGLRPHLGGWAGSTVWVPVGCVLLWAALVLAQSRGAMLSLGLSVAVLVLPMLGSRRAFAVVATAVVAAAAVVVLNGLTNEPPGADLPTATAPDGAGSGRSRSFDPITRDDETDVTSGRIGIYQELVTAVRDHPVAGTGYRTTELNPDLDGSAGHNIYLSTFAETGLVGGILFLALLALPVVRALSGYTLRRGAPAAAGAVMVALSEVFESSILGWGSPTTLLAWTVVVAGACAASTQRVERGTGVLT